MATKTKNTQSSLSDRLDRMVDKISDLASDVTGGDLSPNQIYDQLDKICSDIEKLRDML